MLNSVPRFKSLLHAFIAVASLSFAHLPLYGDGAVVDLTSPKDSDHFEVTRPLLFWTSTPAAKKYEVYIDNALVGEAAASPLPAVHYRVAKPLPVGLHHWSIKAIPASGNAIASVSSTFTIDPPGNWPAWAIGPFERYGKNPLISPQGDTWEAINTFNPGVIFDQGKFHMLYRAQGRGKRSQEGYAESADGVTFTRNPEPVISATEPFEQALGCEDSRLFHYKNTYYAFYTGSVPPEPDATPVANASGGPATVPQKKKRESNDLCEATSSNGTDWKKLGVVVPHVKNAALIADPNGTPVKIDGKFTMFVGNLGIVYSHDLVTWTPVEAIDRNLPPGWVGPWEPCVAVTNYSKSQPDNIVLFIAGTLNGKGKWYYAISEMLFSKADLTKKVAILDDCIMKPQEPYESGQYKNCIWMNCIISHEGQWMMYYGAGDRNVALATAPVK